MSPQSSPQAATSLHAAIADRSRRRRLVNRAVGVVLGLSLASCGAAIAAASESNGNAPVVTRATRYEQQIRSLESRGYVQDRCTRTGTAMYDPSTHSMVTVELG